MHCVHNTLQGLQQLAHTLYVYTCITSSEVSIQYGNTYGRHHTVHCVHMCVHTYVCDYTRNEGSKTSMQAGGLGRFLFAAYYIVVTANLRWSRLTTDF